MYSIVELKTNDAVNSNTDLRREILRLMRLTHWCLRLLVIYFILSSTVLVANLVISLLFITLGSIE